MKQLTIQIQPVRSTGLDAEPAVRQSQGLAAATVIRGNDPDPYINVDFRPADLRALWPAVRERLRSDPALAACSIVCCEGERGWDDYRLLHHFDPGQLLDELG
jgi:hypothetical protein